MAVAVKAPIFPEVENKLVEEAMLLNIFVVVADEVVDLEAVND